MRFAALSRERLTCRAGKGRRTVEVQTIGSLMVLVDTSVWIRFLTGRGPYAHALDELLSRGEVSGHDSIYGELLMGAASGRRALLDDFSAMHRAPMVSPTRKSWHS